MAKRKGKKPMNVYRSWEYRVQLVGEDRPSSRWPVFYDLKFAESYVQQLKKLGVPVAGMIATPMEPVLITKGGKA